jgi:hypothetical protein
VDSPSTAQTAHEEGLDQTPPRRKIVVAGRQRPDAMNVIGQDDDCINGERPLAAHCPEDGSQQAGLGGKMMGPSVAQRDGEEVGRAGNAGAAIVDHE